MLELDEATKWKNPNIHSYFIKNLKHLQRILVICIKSDKNLYSSDMTTAYCVKCREKREIKDPKKVKLKNGKPALKGTCSKCGTTVFRIVKS